MTKHNLKIWFKVCDFNNMSCENNVVTQKGNGILGHIKVGIVKMKRMKSSLI